MTASLLRPFLSHPPPPLFLARLTQSPSFPISHGAARMQDEVNTWLCESWSLFYMLVYVGHVDVDSFYAFLMPTRSALHETSREKALGFWSAFPLLLKMFVC